MRPAILPSFALLALVSLAQAQSTSVNGPATVTRYCFACHNDARKSGNISFQNLRGKSVADRADSWEKILRKVRSGEMPPPQAPQLPPATSTAFVDWLERELDTAAQAHPDPGSPVVHRLNRAEYTNAVRDLLNLDLDHGASLPADDSGHGFDNIASLLTVSPLHMEKYLSASRRVSQYALGTYRSKPAVERYKPSYQRGSELPPGLTGGMSVTRHFPLDAEYSILVRLRGNPAANMPQPMLDIRVDGKRSQLVDVNIDPAEENQQTRNYEIRVTLPAGMHDIAAGLLSESLKAEAGVQRRSFFGPPPASGSSVDYIAIGGPFNPTGVANLPSRDRIYLCRPESGQPEEPCARRILTSLARQAYRRPVTDADIAPLLRLFAEGRKQGSSFESGVEMALRGVLVSPSFLFRAERDGDGKPGSIRPVSDLELASRLSFFLWSSIPDDELLKLAEANQLRPNLSKQVARMLADPKARALVENFAGQWLHLRNVPGWQPDPEKFGRFDDSLRMAFLRETETFFEHIIREDRSVIDLINADYSFVNARLARFYGLPDVRGDYFRKVSVPPAERGGILTHGAILTVTSYPTRTSPVLRGKWILENVLASPPPPPPPDVPDLADSANISARDLRKALEQHRASAACASCHSRLDPLGFSLENYDAIGTYRAKEGGAEIDSSGQLPGGQVFQGASGLKQVLMARKDQFVECLAEKLLTYALGRGLEHPDVAAVREIRRRAAKADYRFSELALAIAESVPFQMRKVPER